MCQISHPVLEPSSRLVADPDLSSSQKLKPQKGYLLDPAYSM